MKRRNYTLISMNIRVPAARVCCVVGRSGEFDFDVSLLFVRPSEVEPPLPFAPSLVNIRRSVYCCIVSGQQGKRYKPRRVGYYESYHGWLIDH